MPVTQICRVGRITVGAGSPLVVIAGPCVLEDERTNRAIAQFLTDCCARLDLPFIFKASFDKANRSSGTSPRGPGIDDGLAMLREISREFDVPVTTDVHLPDQAERAAEHVDLLQVPAFLCRQTDLLQACARTGKAVNVKKGQFLAPVEMRHAITKLNEAGCRDLLLTERGTFFGYHRLVNDFIGLGDLMQLGPPVCFDVTHSTQLPGGGSSTTDGRPERADLIARAAVAAGVQALFIECHPEPKRALSDATTQQQFDAVEKMLEEAAAIRAAMTAVSVEST